MKKNTKIILAIFALLISNILSAQHMSVSSFRCMENDLSARVAKVKDINSELCALIIVNTPVRGLEFSGCNVEKTEQKTGAIWVFVSPGVKFITIMHRDLGQLRNYPFPEPIKSGYVYEMVLQTAKITQTIEESTTEQYLVIKSATPDAKIFVNNEFLGKQSVTKYLSIFNEHSYRVEAPLYHTKEGKVKLNSESKTILQVDLDPAYGYLKVNTTPESGAEIEINGKSLHQTTPCTSDKLESGKYTVQAFKPMYKSEPQRVDITDGKTIEITLELIPTFANAEITCQDKDVEIYIDGDFKAKGNFKGQLSEGVHRLEVKKKSHRPFVKSFTVMSGQDIKETIDVLNPINGKLNINSTPFEADIYIDGKHYGQTPMLISNLIIGDHQLTLKKDGFKPLQENIKIEEGKIAEYNFTLQEKPIKQQKEINNSSSTFTQPTEKNWEFSLNAGVLVGTTDISLTSGNGVSIGMKTSYKLPLYKDIGITVSADLSYQLLPLAEKNRYQEISDSFTKDNITDYYKIVMPKTFCLPIIVGINYDLAKIGSKKIFVEAGYGLNVYKHTNEKHEFVLDNVAGTEIITRPIGVGIVSNIGLGIKLTKRLTLAASYHQFSYKLFDNEVSKLQKFVFKIGYNF